MKQKFEVEYEDYTDTTLTKNELLEKKEEIEFKTAKAFEKLESAENKKCLASLTQKAMILYNELLCIAEAIDNMKG